MQPLDAIFSSPRSAVTREEESGSEDMEISSSELGRTIARTCAAESLASRGNDWQALDSMLLTLFMRKP